MLFALGAFLFLVRPGLLQHALFPFLLIQIALIFTAFMVIIGSLAFFVEASARKHELQGTMVNTIACTTSLLLRLCIAEKLLCLFELLRMKEIERETIQLGHRCYLMKAFFRNRE